MAGWRKALVVGAVAGLLGVMLALTPLGLALERNVGLSGLFWLRGPIAPPDEVVVVGMDRASAERLGLPAPPRVWPRSVHAELIEALTGRGAAVIALDLRLDVPGSDPADDAALAEAIAAAKRVVLFQHLDRMRREFVDAAGQTSGGLTVDRLVSPLPAFAEAAAGLGPFPLPKVPARVDRFWTFKTAAGDSPTLPAVALLLYALDAYDPLLALLQQVGAPGLDGLPPERAATDGPDDINAVCAALRRILLGSPRLGAELVAALAEAGDSEAGALSEAGRRLRALVELHGGADSHYLNFYGPPGTIPTVPYHAVLAGDDGLDLAGRVVFVGLSDLSGTETKEDGFRTVFSRADGVDLSGVEIAATAFANLLDGRGLKATGVPATTGLLLLAGSVGAAAYLLPTLAAVLLTLLTAALYVIGAHVVFGHADLWPPLAIPVLLQLPLALGWGLVDRYRQVSRERRNIDRGARMYLPARLVQELTAEIPDPTARDEIVYGACLLTDIEGYTPLAERLPERELAALMSGYFETVVGPIERHDGVVSDMIGDGLLGIWTAPRPDAAVRAKACLAAVEIAQAVDRFNERAPYRLPTRIGLNAGMTLLGHVGGGGHFAYGVVGDIVNTASRIEGLSKQLGTRLLAAEPAVEGVEGLLLLRPLGRFHLIGKSEPLPIVEILGRAGAANPAQQRLCARFAPALAAFNARRWREAAQLFDALLREHPGDGPSRFYLERCWHYATFEPTSDNPTVIRLVAK